MPEMTGTEFLEEARKLYPDAKKVLLTAYADTEAAIASINSIGLDHYLMKPWEPPEENLYPVLDDLLSDWAATVPVPYDGIRVAGTLWSANSHNVKDFLARNQVPYQWLDIEKSEDVRELVQGVVGDDLRQLPVVFFPDGKTLVDPDNRTLAEKVGLQTQATERFYDLIIVGGGPAGLSAAVYGAAEGLRVVMIEREATGGQAGTSSRIENYLGFPNGLTGADLARRATAQTKRFGVEIIMAQEATTVRVEGPYKIVTLSDGSELSCHALLIATGVSVRRLEAQGIESLTGAGVYYGASLTEAANYRDQPAYVIGGGNSAGQGAMLFSRYASEVTIVVRGPSLQETMSQYLIDQIAATDNIKVLTRTEVAEVAGSDRLASVTLKNADTAELTTVPASAMFIFIGATPYSELVDGLLETNERGFILTGDDLIHDGSKKPKGWSLDRDPYLLEASVPGIFAAGDVRNGTSGRIALAVGQGSTTISFVHEYLKSV